MPRAGPDTYHQPIPMSCYNVIARLSPNLLLLDFEYTLYMKGFVNLTWLFDVAIRNIRGFVVSSWHKNKLKTYLLVHHLKHRWEKR